MIVPAERAILIVDPDLDQGYCVATPLASMGMKVTVSRAFLEAKSLLGSGEYALLVSALHLREYNGLHLVVRARGTGAGIRAIVTELVRDPVLQTEAERLGATYLVTPIPLTEFLAAVSRTLARAEDDTSPPITGPFERRWIDRRLATAAPALPFDRRKGDRRKGFAGLIVPVNPTDTVMS